MAIYRAGKASMSASGVVTGDGTKWMDSLSLIRNGSTIIFLTIPIKIAVISNIVSDTEIRVIGNNGESVDSSDYAILLSDSLTVDGLAQDVAETLRYYQGQESSIAQAIEIVKQIDVNHLNDLAEQTKASEQAAAGSAADAKASEQAAAGSAADAKASEQAAAGSAADAKASEQAAAGSAADAVSDIESAMLQFGYIQVESFENGFTIEYRSQALLLESSGQYYRWNGVLPKNVPNGSTPETSGGVSGSAWVLIGDLSIRKELQSSDGAKLVGSCRSFDELRTITPETEGQEINLSRYSDDSIYGGGVFIAVNSNKEDDGGVIASVSDSWHWMRKDVDYITPEMFGAVGDGSHDDYDSIQRMLDFSPSGAVFFFNPQKVYFNAFENNGLWVDLDKRRIWTRKSSAVFMFNGAMVTRRQAKWADGNAKNNSNTGSYYTDQDTALFKFTGSDTVIHLDRPNIDGANPIGAIKNTSGSDTSATGYAQCECRDYGIYADGIAGISISDAVIKNCCFNIFLTGCKNINIGGYIFQSGQAWKMISQDLALGAGIKLLNCENFNIDINGYKNTNASVEVEPNNNFGFVKVRSRYDYSSTATIYDSGNVNVDISARDVVNGSGIQMVQGGYGGQLKNISGKIVVDGCSWKGLDLRMTSAAKFDITDIDLELNATRCNLTAYHADQTAAATAGFVMRDVNVKVNAHDNANGKTSGYAVRISGDVRGCTSGKIRNAYIGFLCDSGNSATYGHRCRMDLSEEIVNPYSVSSTNYVDWFGTTTPSEIRLMSMAPNVRLSRSGGSGAEQNYGEVWIRTPVLRFANLPINPSSPVSYQAYTNQTVENNVNVFTLRMKY